MLPFIAWHSCSLNIYCLFILYRGQKTILFEGFICYSSHHLIAEVCVMVYQKKTSKNQIFWWIWLLTHVFIAYILDISFIIYTVYYLFHILHFYYMYYIFFLDCIHSCVEIARYISNSVELFFLIQYQTRRIHATLSPVSIDNLN